MKAGLNARRLIWPAIAAGLAGVSAQAAAKSVEATPSAIITEDTRGFISARIGIPIEIRLKAQPGTGFSWVPTRSLPGLTPIRPIKASKAMPGAAQVQRFQFIPATRGTYRLTFSYDQPWRGGTKGAKTKAFIVVAR